MGHAVFELFFGVPQHDVRIRAGEERAFARVQAENPGGIGRCERHELVGADFPGAHAVGPQDG